MAKVIGRRFGQIRALPSGRYQARFENPRGQWHKAPAPFTTHEQGELWLASQRVERAEDRWINGRDSGRRFGVVAEEWKARREARGYRVSTWTRDLGYVDRYLLPRWRDTPLDEIRYHELEDFYLALRKGGGKGGRPLAAGTVGKAASLMHAILEDEVRAKRLRANPAADVPVPRDEEGPVMQFLNPEQISELADAIAPRWRALVLTGCYTGLRIGEAFALRAGAVDLERRRIHVVESATEVEGKIHVAPTTKTKAGRRTVPFPAALVDELTAQLARCDHPDDLVFPNTIGTWQGLSSFRSRVWRPATRAAGVGRLRIHDMRHTAVSLWIVAGAQAKQVSTWAGHTSVSFTLDRYGHLYEDDTVDPMSAVDALLARHAHTEGTITPLHRARP